MIAFRKAHRSLARSRFWRQDVRWYAVGRGPNLFHASHSVAFGLHGATQGDDDLCVMLNGHWEDLDSQVEEGVSREWRRVPDTRRDSPLDFLEPRSESPLAFMRYWRAARSIVILVREQGS